MFLCVEAVKVHFFFFFKHGDAHPKGSEYEHECQHCCKPKQLEMKCRTVNVGVLILSHFGIPPDAAWDSHFFYLTFLCIVFSHSNIHFTNVVVVLIVFSSEHVPSIFPRTCSICLSDSIICWYLCKFIWRQMHIDPLFPNCMHLKCFCPPPSTGR